MFGHEKPNAKSSDITLENKMLKTTTMLLLNNTCTDLERGRGLTQLDFAICIITHVDLNKVIKVVYSTILIILLD